MKNIEYYESKLFNPKNITLTIDEDHNTLRVKGNQIGMPHGRIASILKDEPIRVLNAVNDCFIMDNRESAERERLIKTEYFLEVKAKRLLKVEEKQLLQVEEEKRLLKVEEKQLLQAENEHNAMLSFHKDRIESAKDFTEKIIGGLISQDEAIKFFNKYWTQYGKFKLDVDEWEWRRVLLIAIELKHPLKTAVKVATDFYKVSREELGDICGYTIRTAPNRITHYVFHTSKSAAKKYEEFSKLPKNEQLRIKTEALIIHDVGFLEAATPWR